MRETVKDRGRLEHILEAIGYIYQFSDGISYEDFRKDKMRHFAIEKNIEIIGEASYMLSKYRGSPAPNFIRTEKIIC